MNNKDIGNIGEVSVLKAFIELGIPVYLPYGDNTQADLIADFNGRLNRIQVKTSIKANEGFYVFKTAKSYAHTKRNITLAYTFDEVDYFAFYNLTRQKILLIPYKDLKEGQMTVTIRYNEPKNTGGSSKIIYEKDYLIEKVLSINKLNEIFIKE